MFNKFIFLFFFLFLVNTQAVQKASLQLVWKHQFEFAGFYMAKEKGLYKELGIELEIKEFNNNIDIVKDVEKGISSFGMYYPNIVIDKSKGANIVALNAIFQTSPHCLVSLKSSGIKELKDFKNKKIMIDNNSIKNAPILSMLYSKKIFLSDLEVVEPSFSLDKLINKEVSISSVYLSNEIYKLDEQNIKYNIWNPKNFGFEFYGDILFTSSSLIKTNPTLVKNFQKASLAGWKYAFENIEETVNLIYEKYNTQNKTKKALFYEAKILKDLAYVDNIPFGNIDKSKLQRIFDVYNLMGISKDYIDLDSFIYSDNSDKIKLTESEKIYLQKNKKITMCIDPNWMPFEKLDNGKHIGMSADYISIFEKKLGIEISLVKTNNWTETLKYAKNRKCDIVSLAAKTKKRKEYLNFTEPYLNIPLVIATKTDIKFIDKFSDLKEQKIVIPKGYAFVEILREKYPYLNIIEVDNVNDGLQKVKTGEAFGFIGSLVTIGYQIQNNFLGELKIAGKFDEVWKLSVGVRNDDNILLSILNKTIKNVSNANHQKILHNWATIKYVIAKDYTLLIQILLVFSIVLIFFAYRQYLLNKTNKVLETRVNLQTKKLKNINNNLEERIILEVQKIGVIEKQLYETKKLAAMGEMIGNIAHQWRQPLSMISTSATTVLLQKEFDMLSDDKLKTSMNNINNSAQFLSKTIDDFSNMIKGDTSMESFNLSKNLEKCFSIENPMLKMNEIEIIENLDDSIVLTSYPNVIIQSMINIINNAKDILIENKIKRNLIFVDTFTEDNHAFIAIKDNAGGIPTDVIEHIFEAYFTTKHKSQGTGLGLNMTYNMIVSDIKGTITASNITYEYENISYTGALFTIKIPLVRNDEENKC